MNWLKKALPHIVAVVIFLIVTVLFCKPILDGKVLNQHDIGISGWKGAAQNAFEVKEKTGKLPLWNTNVFSGMPNYQIAMEGKPGPMPDLNKIIGLWLPKPMNFFFIACVCFYFLCIVLRLNPVTGIFGALAFAYSTYNPLIISAGHETKMMAIAYMPLLLAGLLLIFNRTYWAGLAVATLGATLELMANHPQINYYFFLIAAAVSIGYLITWLKNKDYKHILISFALSAVAAAIAFGCYSLAYLSTKEYTRYTMRGGKTLEIDGDQVKAVKTTGLDIDYAFKYSMSNTEPLVMLMPNATGGSSITPIPENSKTLDKLVNAGVPEMQATQFLGQMPLMYWGGMSKPGEYSGGPAYIGAIIFILALIGFVVVKHPLKWPLLIVTILSVLMSWGSYFLGFNSILLSVLPLYNKFRAPSMALVIAEFTMPLMACITVYTLFFSKNSKAFLQATFKKILYTLGGLTLLLGLLYLTQSYSSGFDEQVMQMKLDPSGNDTINRTIISGLKADRQSMFGGQVLRSILFMVVVLGAIYAYMKNILKPVIAVSALALISTIDLWIVDKKYFGDDHYIAKDELQTEIATPSAIDQEISKDKDPHYRVLAAGAFDDNRVSYYHRSVLGYHPAKLRIYQDILEKYFNGQPNEQILNALDVRYVIATNQQGQQQLLPNPNAYGAAWFVKTVKPVSSEAEELQSIGKTNLKDTAIVQQANLKQNGNITADSSSTISLTKYTNDEIEYTANTPSGGFAVFSEVYYPAGWNAFIDGKPTDIIKTDYVLRGLIVPSGKHAITFTFDPKSVKRGVNITYISSWLFPIVVILGFFMQWWIKRRTIVKK